MKENWLIEILLPLRGNAGNSFPQAHYTAIRKTLTEKFGGLTAFTRAPAEGFWQPEEGEPVNKDEIVIFEVMTETLDREWWRNYREKLERLFNQDKMVIRAREITRI
jgi:hypothetical protein